ncbi:Fic/DOC family protein [Proteus hauseri]|uniref:Fic/DOC family protein n=1 Tax=Proteus hauseri TaxID=183417 RepID=UPI0032DAE728
MDKYDVANDCYCYPKSPTLKNKLNIQAIDLLEQAEREITALTIQNIKFYQPPYDFNYICSLHYQLFSNLYEWAGKVLTIDISKGGTRFCTCIRILPEINRLLSQLKNNNWLMDLSTNDFCEKLA